jgi:hypothetical protein
MTTQTEGIRIYRTHHMQASNVPARVSGLIDALNAMRAEGAPDDALVEVRQSSDQMMLTITLRW